MDDGGRRSQGIPSIKSLPSRYRDQETVESFENQLVNVRFGTEGSEVQILSPRPVFLRLNGVDRA